MNDTLPLKNMHVAILCTDGFEQVEMTEPRKALENAGAVTKLIAPQSGEVQGMNHDEKADKFPVDMSLDEVNLEDFDAVLLPGGVINADRLRMDKKAQVFVNAIDDKRKPIAVICHGPWLLVSAKLVNGRTMTSYYTLQDDITNAGGSWVDMEVIRDNNWVSSRMPSDIPAFNREMIRIFSEYLQNIQAEKENKYHQL